MLAPRIRQDPLVTILTPTYNQAQFVAETVESVLAQDYPHIEYIVIDDGSTDGTADVLQAYASRITYIRQDNAGQAATINRGIELAKGNLFGYLSSDDLLAPTAISKLVEVFREKEQIACVFPDADLIDPSSRVVKRRVCRPFDRMDLLVRQECYIGPGAIFRTDMAKALGGWRRDLKLAPDREFWLRMARLGEIDFLPEVLAGYRLHGGSISYSETSEAQSLEYIRVLDDYFAETPPSDPAVARRDEAYAYAHFLIARNCFRSWRFATGGRHYLRAVRLHPKLFSPSAWITLIRTTVSKPVRLLQGRLGSLTRQVAAG